MTASRRGRRPARRSGGFWGGLKDILIIIVVAVVVSFVIRTFFFRAFLIPSGSMENTLQINDRIFVNLIVDSQDQLNRGDVVVFEDHEGWLPPSDSKPNPVFQALEFVGLYPSNAEQHLVKRIIGMPGDHVTVDPETHQLVINDTAIDEPYLADDIVGSDIEFDVTVPDGKLWVMGDHRNESGDSRAHMDGPNDGFVDIDTVVGRAEIVAWPLDRWGSAGSDDQPFEQVPAP
ncbi:MAG TPA: signal peptidase I [Candidatus Yaniella excrementigallinarum]|nr:signal peptidase I [Candidatus Yaniella excrementigallinarum]